MENILAEAFPFWDKLDSRERAQLINNAEAVRYESGEHIYSSGDKCLGIIIIKSGEVRAYMLSEEGRDVTIFRLKDNDVCVLTASCILQSVTFDIFVDAEKDTEGILINAAAFDRIQKENVHVENFAQSLAIKRFSDVMRSFERIMFYKLDKRIALLLIEELDKSRSGILRLTHEQIAKYVGSARETVSRTLKRMEREGVLLLGNGEISVIDRSSLEEYTL